MPGKVRPMPAAESNHDHHDDNGRRRHGEGQAADRVRDRRPDLADRRADLDLRQLVDDLHADLIRMEDDR